MGEHFETLLKSVFPHAFVHHNFPRGFVVKVITFDSKVDEFQIAHERFPFCSEKAQGSTYMAGAFYALRKYLLSLQSNTHVDVIAVSDGLVDDMQKTLFEALYLKDII
eukprot:UN06992